MPHKNSQIQWRECSCQPKLDEMPVKGNDCRRWGIFYLCSCVFNPAVSDVMKEKIEVLPITGCLVLNQQIANNSLQTIKKAFK